MFGQQPLAETALRAPTVVRHAADSRTDRERIDTAFRALRAKGYAARMSVELPPSETYDTPAVYWYKSQDHVFEHRNLFGPLDMHWQGDPTEIIAALRFEGIRALDLEGVHMPIRLLPHEASVHRFLAQPGAIAARDYKRPCYVCGKGYPAHVTKSKRS